MLRLRKIADSEHIFKEQQLAFELLFKYVDPLWIVFVGGVADYLNLREYYDMPVHDIDVVYERQEDIQDMLQVVGAEQHQCKFYENDNKDVLTSEFHVNGMRVHFDFFRRNFFSIPTTRSQLLGRTVQYASFDEMQRFHNEHIPKLTSRATGRHYEWKRLYKHSKKASLYNNVCFLKERGEIKSSI